MEDVLRFALDLIATHAQWIGVNLAIPLALPVLGACMASTVAPTSTSRFLGSIVDSVRFGQLGWMAIAWTCSSMFDGWQFTKDAHVSSSWMGWSILIGFVTTSFGTFSAVACTPAVCERKGRRIGFAISLATVLVAAGTMIYTHHKVTG